MPLKTVIGPGALGEIAADLKKRELKRCLVVTDAFMAKSAVAAKLYSLLGGIPVECTVFDGVQANPTLSQVAYGVRLYLQNNCDVLVSLGGGSAHDCAKGIKITLLQGSGISARQVFFIAVNTTAGTGSEVTKFSILTDEQTHYKLSAVDERLIPDIAVDDSSLMRDMPPALTAATGMDALTHAMESYVSRGSNPATRCGALEAVRLIRAHLARAFADGTDLDARTGMAYAQYLAGAAFSNSGLGLVHAMAHQLGGLYQLSHGLCNAVLLPFVVEYNLLECPAGYARLAAALGACGEDTAALPAGRRLIRHLFSLNRKLGIPRDLSALKVDPRDCGKLAEMAMQDPSLPFNPRTADPGQIEELYLKACGKRNSQLHKTKGVAI